LPEVFPKTSFVPEHLGILLPTAAIDVIFVFGTFLPRTQFPTILPEVVYNVFSHVCSCSTEEGCLNWGVCSLFLSLHCTPPVAKAIRLSQVFLIFF